MKEQSARELDRLLDTDIHTIADKNIWMLDMDQSDRIVMNMQERQYIIFELKAAHSQDNAVEEITDRGTRDVIEHCRIPGMCVPTRNISKHKSYIEEERARRKKRRKGSSCARKGSNKAGK
jgi:hypothetical protein